MWPPVLPFLLLEAYSYGLLLSLHLLLLIFFLHMHHPCSHARKRLCTPANG
jgi:hypothetical protein